MVKPVKAIFGKLTIETVYYYEQAVFEQAVLSNGFKINRSELAISHLPNTPLLVKLVS